MEIWRFFIMLSVSQEPGFSCTKDWVSLIISFNKNLTPLRSKLQFSNLVFLRFPENITLLTKFLHTDWENEIKKKHLSLVYPTPCLLTSYRLSPIRLKMDTFKRNKMFVYRCNIRVEYPSELDLTIWLPISLALRMLLTPRLALRYWQCCATKP